AVVVLLLHAGAGPALGGEPRAEAPGTGRHDERPASGESPEQRNIAIRKLEESARLAPSDTRVLSELARAYLRSGFTRAAQQTFERIIRLAPGDAAAREGLGRVWKRDWLATLDPGSLQKAIESFTDAVQLDPGLAGAWATLAVLRVEQGDAGGAGLC